MSKAIDTFRTSPWVHNCAQAVAFKWAKLYASPDTIVANLAGSAAGRAEGGICGALYAATLALPQHKDDIINDFRQQVGYTTCRDIKLYSHTPCPNCVDLADQLVEKYIK